MAGKKVSDGKFDILKLVMSFFIVAIHTGLFPMILYPWLRVAVPLFFMITGYFFFSKLSKVSDYRTQVSVVKNFVVRNIKLYVFWVVVLFPIILYIRKDVFFGKGVIKGILSFVHALLAGSTFTGAWYILASVYCIVIMFFLLRRISNRILLPIVSVLYVFISLMSSYGSIVFEYPAIKGMYDFFCDYIQNPVTSFLVGLVWLTCGKCFAERTFDMKRISYIIISVVSAVALYTEWRFVINLDGSYNNDCYIMLLPLCIGLFGWVNSLEKIELKHSLYFRRCSTVIYVTHGAVRTTVFAVYNKVLHIDSIFLGFLTSVIICICIYALIELVLYRYKDKRFCKVLQYAY